MGNLGSLHVSKCILFLLLHVASVVYGDVVLPGIPDGVIPKMPDIPGMPKLEIPEIPGVPKIEIPTIKFPGVVEGFLGFNFYSTSCPGAQTIISGRVKYWLQKDPSLAASLLNLHFVDCMIRGCDGSILLNQPGSERQSEAAKDLRGFEVIDDIKSELERRCPGTVSCADVLAVAARDATVSAGGPFWDVVFGRRDGRMSIASEMSGIPMGNESVTYLIELFQSRGLGLLDLVALSGMHTIGKVRCGRIQDRLFNFKGTGKADPSIDPRYLNFLKRKCRWASEFVDLDPTTPNKFDNAYYVNLEKKMGLLSSDQLLYSDSRTYPLVSAFANQPGLFRHQFAVSMMNLADTQVLTGEDEGEIRAKCSSANP